MRTALLIIAAPKVNLGFDRGVGMASTRVDCAERRLAAIGQGGGPIGPEKDRAIAGDVTP
jgi:hypothetical protein